MKIILKDKQKKFTDNIKKQFNNKIKNININQCTKVYKGNHNSKTKNMIQYVVDNVFMMVKLSKNQKI